MCIRDRTNLVAIVLSVAGTFLFLGVRGASSGEHVSGWVRRAIVIMFMVTIVLLLPLISNVVEQKRRGQVRPLTYPVAAHVQEAVQEYLDSVPDVTLITIARVSVEPASSVSVLLATAGALPVGLKQDLTELVRDVRGGNPEVRIIALREIHEQP